jgi:hypothetical protein
MTTRHVSSPYRNLPLSAGAPDTTEVTARSSRTARMAVFMMIVLLSGQLTECCGGSRRRYLYRGLLGGSGEWKLRHFFFLKENFAFVIETTRTTQKLFCSQGRNYRWTNILIYSQKCASDRLLLCVLYRASSLQLNDTGVCNRKWLLQVSTDIISR